MKFLRYKKAKGSFDFAGLQDAELIDLFKRSANTELVGVLFERYTHLVYGVCMKYLRDEEESRDGVMQIFEDLLTSLKSHEIKNFKGWLYATTKNYCLMQLRKVKTHRRAVEYFTEKSQADLMETLGEMHHKDRARNNYTSQQLTEALKMLNEKQRRCTELVYLHNKSYKEISEITGYSLKQVKSHVQNAKRNLKINLEKQNDREA